MININIITLFPNFFKTPLETGVLGRAIQVGCLKIRFVNPRDFTEDKYQSVDDSPFGGGDGMVMKYEPLKKAVDFLSTNEFTDASESAKERTITVFSPTSGSVARRKLISRPVSDGSMKQTEYNEKKESEYVKKSKNQSKNRFVPEGTRKIIYLSPQGKKWDYKKARACAEQNRELTFVCGRYGGVDQRFISEYVEEEISIGDYVLTGGEPALLVILDSLSRFVKGALGNERSCAEESFEHQGLLEAPQWTKPQKIKGYQIPEVILSGHHKNIKNFRYLMSIFITAVKRPDLLMASPARKDLPSAVEMLESFSKEELNSCGINEMYLKTIKKSFEIMG